MKQRTPTTGIWLPREGRRLCRGGERGLLPQRIEIKENIRGTDTRDLIPMKDENGTGTGSLALSATRSKKDMLRVGRRLHEKQRKNPKQGQTRGVLYLTKPAAIQ